MQSHGADVLREQARKHRLFGANILADECERDAAILEAIAKNAGDFESVRGHLMDSGRALLSFSPGDAERYQAAEAILRAAERSA